MRKELELINIIEKYLLGELEGDQLIQFESKLSASKTLQEEVEKQRLVMEGVKNSVVRGKVKKAKKTFQVKKWGWNGLFALMVAGVVAAGIYSYDQFFGEESTSENIKYELNEEGTDLWSEADEMIASQFYTVDNGEGMVLQTDQGMIIAIPEGAFLDASGNPVQGDVELEIKEALDAESIMLAGLSTKSGDDLLETGGMFYLNGRKDGETLQMNPDQPIVVEVPTDEVKSGMELFQGVRQEDGGLDWQDPKPIEQFLTPVDIHSLDFYPPNYEQGLASLGYSSESKAWKDSVYYSFGGESTSATTGVVLHSSGVIPDREPKGWELDTLGYDPVADAALIADGISIEEAKKLGYYYDYSSEGLGDSTISQYLELNPSKVQTVWNDQFQNTLMATKEFEERMPFIHCVAKDEVLAIYVNNQDKKLSTIDSMVVDCLGGMEGDWEDPIYLHAKADLQKGKELFNANCASCHKTAQAATGPALAGSKQRWNAYGEGDYIYTWIQDNGALRNSGISKRAQSISIEYLNAVMTSFPALTKEDIDNILAYSDWDAKQQGYDLEKFSEVLDFKMVDESGEVDVSDVEQAEGEQAFDICLNCDIEQLKSKFAEFALQNKGRVEMDLKAIQMLKDYYEKHAKVNALAAEKVQEQFLAEMGEAKAKLQQDQNAKQLMDIVRDGQNLAEEIDLNLDETYKQLGIKRPKYTVNPGAAKYTIPIVTPGWKNIDRIVAEGTIARETINVEYGGKTAEIKYETMSLTVVDKSEYDRVFVYLLPNKLNSFQRITKVAENGNYTENLNEFINYDLAVVGYKGETIYLGHEEKIGAQYYNITLWETDEGDLSSVLHHTGKKKYKKTLVQDMLDQQSLMLQGFVVDKMEDVVAFRQGIKEYIFNCNSFVDAVDDVSPEGSYWY